MGNATLTKLWNVCPDNFEAAAGEYLFISIFIAYEKAIW